MLAANFSPYQERHLPCYGLVELVLSKLDPHRSSTTTTSPTRNPTPSGLNFEIDEKKKPADGKALLIHLSKY